MDAETPVWRMVYDNALYVAARDDARCRVYRLIDGRWAFVVMRPA